MDRYNRQLHPDERQWAKGHAKAFADYYKRETGQAISQEDAYQRLLSAGYADVDKLASDTGMSDAKAKQFIAVNAPGSLFQKDHEWNKPLAGGNADGSQTPEQQARFGSRTPSLLAQQQYSNTIKLAQQPCVDAYACGEKVEKITTTIQALEQQKALYQDDPEQRRRIVDQEASLLRNLTPKEITQARLASADQSTMLDVLVLTKVPAAVADLVTALKAGTAGRGGELTRVSESDNVLRDSRLAGASANHVAVEIAPSKFDYLFGQVDSNVHNAARSNQLALEMKRLGVPNTDAGRQLVTNHLSRVAAETDNISRTFSNQYGSFEVRESLFLGPSGQAAKFESTFQVLPDGTRRLSTVIPFNTGKSR